jgi:hypothetical protein
MLKNILLVLLVLFIGAQFIRPERNLGQPEGPNFIGIKHPLSPEVHALLERACYNCHSNKTDYPWYANVQPVAWWLASHVKDGKRHYNLSEFGTYNAKREAEKLKETAGEVREGGMPLPSYTWMHPEARLTDAERKLIIDWAEGERGKLPAPAKP